MKPILAAFVLLLFSLLVGCALATPFCVIVIRTNSLPWSWSFWLWMSFLLSLLCGLFLHSLHEEL